MLNHTSFSSVLFLLAVWSLLQQWFQPWLYSGIMWEALTLGPNPETLIVLGCSLSAGIFSKLPEWLYCTARVEKLHHGLLWPFPAFSASPEGFPPAPYAHFPPQRIAEMINDDTSTEWLHGIHKISVQREQGHLVFMRLNSTAQPDLGIESLLWEQRGQALLTITLGGLYSREH